jgi:transcriptional regulator with XRE-family HTH domain
MTLSQRLVSLREHAGLTPAQLAQKISMPEADVTLWESGTAEPGFSALQALCGVYGLSLDALTVAVTAGAPQTPPVTPPPRLAAYRAPLKVLHGALVCLAFTLWLMVLMGFLMHLSKTSGSGLILPRMLFDCSIASLCLLGLLVILTIVDTALVYGRKSRKITLLLFAILTLASFLVFWLIVIYQEGVFVFAYDTGVTLNKFMWVGIAEGFVVACTFAYGYMVSALAYPRRVKAPTID